MIAPNRMKQDSSLRGSCLDCVELRANNPAVTHRAHSENEETRRNMLYVCVCVCART